LELFAADAFTKVNFVARRARSARAKVHPVVRPDVMAFRGMHREAH